MRDGGIVKPSVETIPHPRCGSPLCTRGPCIRMPINQNFFLNRLKKCEMYDKIIPYFYIFIARRVARK